MAFCLAIPTIYSGELSPTDYCKLDPMLSLLLDHPELKPLIFNQMTGDKLIKSITNINVIMKTTFDKSTLRKLGVKVQAQIGNIVTATIPIDLIPNLLTYPEISYIQGPRIMKIHNDVSVSEIGGTQARQQYNLSGKDVIIGIVDTGIDWQHQDFRNPDGSTRILAILDLSEAGSDHYGGILYTEQEINNALNGIGTVTQRDYVGHGTHVAGTAAGNGRATGNVVPANTYVGVAPEADLVIIKATLTKESINFDPYNYINSVVFIDSIARVHNKPYVINLSLGGNFGPHDGKDLSEQAIDILLTTPGEKGKAVVVSAGNDGNQAIHASGSFSGSTSNIETQFTISSYTPNSSTTDDYVLFDGWYDGLYNYSIKIATPSGLSYGPISTGRDALYDTQDGAIDISNAKGGPSNLNGDNQILIQIYDYFVNKPPKEGVWKITISGTAGRFDLWLSGASMDVEITSCVDNTMIVSTPGTAFKAITVGAYNTKKSWTDLDGNKHSRAGIIIGDAATFSSPGPTRDFRIKPEITAPGQFIAASYSADASPSSSSSIFYSSSLLYPNYYIVRDNKHGISQGTSFSAPHVTGTIALMLEQYPNKTPSEIREAIISTARMDGFTGNIPNNKWGYGKIDVLAALEHLEINNPIAETSVPRSIKLNQNYPNPFNPTTVISYSIHKTTKVQLAVYNVLGQKIRTLFNDMQEQGIYKVIWDGNDDVGKAVASGIYFYRLITDGHSQTRKMILLP